MDVLIAALLLASGFVGCAEFASVVLVHPVIRRLPEDGQFIMEKGLLTTFGRVMPIGMTAVPILAGVAAARDSSTWFIVAAITFTVALVVTIAGNVPINQRTRRMVEAPESFIHMRRRWDLFQAVRGTLQLAGFVLVVLGATTA